MGSETVAHGSVLKQNGVSLEPVLNTMTEERGRTHLDGEELHNLSSETLNESGKDKAVWKMRTGRGALFTTRRGKSTPEEVQRC